METWKKMNEWPTTLLDQRNTDGAQSQDRNNTQNNFFPPTGNFINTYNTTELLRAFRLVKNLWLVVPFNTHFTYSQARVDDECKQTSNHDHDIYNRIFPRNPLLLIIAL